MFLVPSPPGEEPASQGEEEKMDTGGVSTVSNS